MAYSALSYALSLVKRRLRSVWEIDQALLLRGVEPEERQSVIEQLTQAGLLDDARFALAWIHERDRFSPRGWFLIERELQQKGLSKEIILTAKQARQEEAAEEAVPVDDETQARELLKRRERLYVGLVPDVKKRRQMSFLARRGFSPGVVRRILNP